MKISDWRHFESSGGPYFLKHFNYSILTLANHQELRGGLHTYLRSGGVCCRYFSFCLRFEFVENPLGFVLSPGVFVGRSSEVFLDLGTAW